MASRHPRAYVIGPKSDDRFERHVQIGRLGLSFGPHIAYRTIRDGETTWHLLGNAYSTRGSIPNETSGIHAECFTWAGRWILISDKGLIPDCAASIACFYSDTASDNPKLVTDAEPSDPVALGKGYVIPPETGYSGLSKLLPSQMLDLATMRPVPRPIPWRDEGGSYEERIERISGKLRTAMRGFADEQSNIWTALTAGHDSRLVLSIAHAARLSITAYTMRKPWAHTDPADVSIPPKLAALAGAKHVFVPSGRPDWTRLNQLQCDLPQTVPGAVPYYLAAGTYDRFEEGAAHLNGVYGEMGRLYYAGKAPLPLDAEAIAGVAPDTPGNRRGAERLADWWGIHPLDIDPLERLYWECRAAGWAEVSQRHQDYAYGHKIVDVPILNCLDTFNEMLHLPADKRSNEAHVLDLIALMLPQVSSVPVNPRQSFAPRAMKKIARVLESRR